MLIKLESVTDIAAATRDALNMLKREEFVMITVGRSNVAAEKGALTMPRGEKFALCTVQRRNGAAARDATNRPSTGAMYQSRHVGQKLQPRGMQKQLQEDGTLSQAFSRHRRPGRGGTATPARRGVQGCCGHLCKCYQEKGRGN
jgi:hypothetical protein